MFWNEFDLPTSENRSVSLSFFHFSHALNNPRIDTNAPGQVKRVLRALTRTLLRSESSLPSSMSPPTTSETTAHGGDGDDAAADASSAPKKTKQAGSKAAEEACAAAERIIGALEEHLAKEEGKGDDDDEAAAGAAAATPPPTAAAKSRRLALSLSFAPLADALLSLVAPDWLCEFTEEESRELFDAIFFDGAAAAEALEALCDHLGSVRPISSSKSPEDETFLPFGPSAPSSSASSSAMTVAAPGARAAARLLASRFVAGGGVRELLLEEAAAKTVADAWRKAMERGTRGSRVEKYPPNFACSTRLRSAHAKQSLE